MLYQKVLLSRATIDGYYSFTSNVCLYGILRSLISAIENIAMYEMRLMPALHCPISDLR